MPWLIYIIRVLANVSSRRFGFLRCTFVGGMDLVQFIRFRCFLGHTLAFFDLQAVHSLFTVAIWYSVYKGTFVFLVLVYAVVLYIANYCAVCYVHVSFICM